MSMFLRLLAGGLVVIACAPSVAFADNASDIQALKEQVRAMQQKIDQLSAQQPQQTTGTVPPPAPTNQGTAATDERKRREVPSTRRSTFKEYCSTHGRARVGPSRRRST